MTGPGKTTIINSIENGFIIKFNGIEFWKFFKIFYRSKTFLKENHFSFLHLFLESLRLEHVKDVGRKSIHHQSR